MKAVLLTLFISTLSWDDVGADAALNSLRAAAAVISEPLPCGRWDCGCASRQSGCCCGSDRLLDTEEQTFERMMKMSIRLSQLTDSVLEVTEGIHVAFTASMSPRADCFGPFNRKRSIPYDVITLNQGGGYNPALGVFTAPRSGLYSLSFSVYSRVDQRQRTSYRVQMVRNGAALASTWEENREDGEDSNAQTLLLSLQRGDQVYVELLPGKQLCGLVAGLNSFSGSLLYPQSQPPLAH